MKRSLMAGMALVFMASGPLAYAQQDDHNKDQHAAPAHEQAHAAPAHPAPMAANHAESHMAPAHEMAPPRQVQERQPVMASHSQHQWREGDRYNGARHQVDWRSHHLRQPPNGYEWVQNGNDYVLIAIGSGIVAGIIANALSH